MKLFTSIIIGITLCLLSFEYFSDAPSKKE